MHSIVANQAATSAELVQDPILWVEHMIKHRRKIKLTLALALGDVVASALFVLSAVFGVIALVAMYPPQMPSASGFALIAAESFLIAMALSSTSKFSRKLENVYMNLDALRSVEQSLRGEQVVTRIGRNFTNAV
jgi:hypothetical protein